MLRLWGCIGVFLIIVGLTACKDSETTPSVSEMTTNTPVQVTPTVKEDGILLRDRMKLLTFSQYNTIFSTTIEWKSNEIPNDIIEIPFHMEELSIRAEYTWFKNFEDEPLKNEIQVYGNVQWEVKPNPYYSEGIIIRFYKPNEAFSVQISDLPELKFVPKAPIEYSLLNESGDKPSSLLVQGIEYGTQFLIPVEDRTVTLAFSEEMLTTILPTHTDGTSIESEWLDSKHLRIQMVNMGVGENGTKEKTINLDNLRAKSNDNLRVERTSFTVRQFSDIEWRDNKTGAPVGFSPRDRFYHQLIPSPNGQSYIGVVRVGGSLGDGDGTFYSYVLERPNQEPVMIEHQFYSTIEPFDLPVQWIDNHRILYSAYNGVFIYDIVKGEKITLKDTENSEQDYINFAVYDSNRKQFHVLAADSRDETYTFNLFTYEDGQSTPKQTKDFTSSVMIQKYSMMDMTIVPTKSGTYWTIIEDGIPYTEFINHDGKKFKVEGYIRAVGDTGVYLERFKAGEVLESIGYSYWQPGKKAQAITIPEYNEIFANGSNLIIKFDSKFLVYNSVTRKWDNWKAAGGEKEAVPVRGANGLYYIQTNLSFGGLTIGSTEAEIIQRYGENYTWKTPSDGKKSIFYQDTMTSFELENGKLIKAEWSPQSINQTLQTKYQIPINKSDIDFTKKYEVIQESCYHTAVCNNYVFTSKGQKLQIRTDWGDNIIDRVELEVRK
jgi:hypothetical protein